MDIIYILKGSFQENPPVISTVLALLDLGHKVTIVAESVTAYWEHKLKKRDVQFVLIKGSASNSRIEKLKSYLRFRKSVYNFISKQKDSLLWIEGGHTIACLGEGIKAYKYVLQILELHETNKMFMKAIGKVINDAKSVFVCEYNRAVLYQLWFKMSQRPIVLPNKPYFNISKDELVALKEKYKNKLQLFEGKKSIIYQGHIGKGRDLSTFVKAIKGLGSDYQIVLVGQNHGESVEKYQAIDSRVIHIDYMPAPDYLVFTSMAYLGIISYDVSSLNNIYCAPNKIWEYSMFGIPLLCNDIPGLKYMVEVNGAGVCVNENDTDNIIRAIKTIETDYKHFTFFSKKLYDSIDNKCTIESALKQLDN